MSSPVFARVGCAAFSGPIALRRAYIGRILGGCFLLLSLSSFARADSFTWSPPLPNGGPPDDSWDNPLNWTDTTQDDGTPNTQVPGQGDTASITNGMMVLNENESIDLMQLTGGNSLTLNGYEFTAYVGLQGSAGNSLGLDGSGTFQIEGNGLNGGVGLVTSGMGAIIDFYGAQNSLGSITSTNGADTVGATINFTNGSSGGSLNIASPGAIINFTDTSDAGGTTINTQSGSLNFSGSSTAGSAVITSSYGNITTFSGSSGAAISTLTVGDNSGHTGSLNFQDEASADNASIYNEDAGTTTFSGYARATSATIINAGNATNSALLSNSPGLIEGVVTFEGDSTAGYARITNNGGQIVFQDYAGAGAAFMTNNNGQINFTGNANILNGSIAAITNSGLVTFDTNATASASTIINESSGIIGLTGNSTLGVAYVTNSGQLGLEGSASAGAATINNFSGGQLGFDGNSTLGSAFITNNGELAVLGSASAGTATINNESGGQLEFQGNTTAGKTIIINAGGGVMDISGMAANANNINGLKVGSIAGAGTFDLGSKTLQVGSLNTSTTVSGVIQDGGVSGGTGGSLSKVGTGTLTLSGVDSYSGGTSIAEGTIDLDATTGSLAANSSLVFEGTGTFNDDNSASGSSAKALGLGSLTFSGGEGTVESTPGTATPSTILGFSSLTRAKGATGNFVDNFPDQGHNAPNNGTVNKFVLNGQATGFIDPGIFYGGSNYATFDAAGYVRGINYGVDANSLISPGGQTMTGVLTSSSNVELSGAITQQASTTINTLNLGANSLTLDNTQILTVNGILESGGSATISGGSGLVYGGYRSDSDLVVRVNQASDSLTISTPISAAILTKSGAGVLYLNDSYNGTTEIANGSIGLGYGFTLTGNMSIASGGSLSGSGTVNGKITVNAGGSTYPGDPQILTASSIEYQSGSTAQFAVATTAASGHPPVAGTDYDQLKLTGGTAGELQIDSGTTTLQFNLSATSLAALQANAQSNPGDLYFLFTLGSGTSSGQFSNLTLTEAGNTYTDAISNGTAVFAPLGLQFNLSYTANSSTDSMLNGDDVAFSVQAAPEPAVWALMVFGCAGLMILRRGGRPA